jgi:Recombination directionality factor-like
MSPILDIQRRGRQIGEIRIGMQVRTSNGKMRPTKLDAFRFTTKSPAVAEAVAHLFGGEVRAIELGGMASHEVITEVTELPVMVPPGDAVISQWYEMWSGGGCQRRCDGETEQLTQEPCKCPTDPERRNALAKTGGACKPTTRVNVMLPDLPDLGVWKIESHGYNAANELGGAAEVLAAARNSGVIIPAVLRLEQRQSKSGGETRKFAVPVLEIRATLRQLTELNRGADITSALPPEPPQALQALGTGKPRNVDLCHIPPGTDKAGLRAEWKKRFDFSTTEVPLDREAEARALIACFAGDDEPVDAELVGEPDDASPTGRRVPPTSESEAGVSGLDSGRPF